MSRTTQWLSLCGGVVVLLFGMKKLYEEADGVLLILGLLIVAFTVSNMIRRRRREKAE